MTTMFYVFALVVIVGFLTLDDLGFMEVSKKEGGN